MKRGYELKGNPSRITAPRGRAPGFTAGVACCYCGDPLFRSQRPHHEGGARWSHSGCASGSTGNAPAVPYEHEIATFLRQSLEPGDDLHEEVRSWQLRFWLRSFPAWPSLKTKGTKADTVAETMDEIEQALIEGLDGRQYDTVQDVGLALTQAVDRYVQTSKLERVDAVPPLHDFTDWVSVGEGLRFIRFSPTDNTPDSGRPGGPN